MDRFVVFFDVEAVLCFEEADVTDDDPFRCVGVAAESSSFAFSFPFVVEDASVDDFDSAASWFDRFDVPALAAAACAFFARCLLIGC